MKLRVFILFLLFAVAIASTSHYVPTDPTTWTPNELKEWLAEHRVSYKGIPDKQELVNLVKNNWQDVKGRANSTTEAVESFVSRYVNAVKDAYYNTEEQEKYDEFVQEVADQIESIRQTTGLTEEQTQSTISEVIKRLKGTKAEGSKALINALNDIQKSYTTAQAKRDVLIQKTVNRVQDDIQKAGEVSQDTLNWFKDEINKMSEVGAFAKARTETQISLILQGVQETLTKRKVYTTEQINATYEKLNSITIKGTLERLRHQLSTVNNKIQNSVDAIGQKLTDGKDLTVDQLNQIKSSINHYFTAVKDYYNAATGQVKQTVLDTKRAQEERINKIIESVRSSINDGRKKSNHKVSDMIRNIEDNVSSTQQLTAEQTKILSETIQEQFGNLKDARDLSEDKVESFVDALRTRFAAIRDYAADTYDSASQKVGEGYNVAYNKVSSSAESVGESVGEGYEKVKEHLTHQKEEL
jgi:polyhydroxyalkanoate synthesis regulator phasin